MNRYPGVRVFIVQSRRDSSHPAHRLFRLARAELWVTTRPVCSITRNSRAGTALSLAAAPAAALPLLSPLPSPPRRCSCHCRVPPSRSLQLKSKLARSKQESSRNRVRASCWWPYPAVKTLPTYRREEFRGVPAMAGQPHAIVDPSAPPSADAANGAEQNGERGKRAARFV